MEDRGTQTNQIWKTLLKVCSEGHEVKPRGFLVREHLCISYSVPAPAFLTNAERKVNIAFMCAEPWWILTGSNQLSCIEPYMKNFRDYSDDGEFMRGAYGPKIIDQLPYVLEVLLKDKDSRQAVLTVWRERPGKSKDVPCTVSMQFFIRDNKLYTSVYMRSQDIVLGFTYDSFSFSMVAQALRLLLKSKGVKVELGDLHVSVGSLHVYERHFEKIQPWIDCEAEDVKISGVVKEIMQAETFDDLKMTLKDLADENR